MAVASEFDVENALRRELTEDEKKWTNALLDRIEGRILASVPDAVDKCRVNDLWRSTLADVESEAVARVLRAPGGGLYRSEQEGDYQYALNTMVASGKLGLLPEEWARLKGVWHSIMPVTDGYARERFKGYDPAFAWQAYFPAYDSLAEWYEGGFW